MKHLAVSIALSFASLSAAAILSGCSTNFGNTSVATTQVAIGGIRGVVKGGQQPITGADIFLFAVGSGLYGGSSISLLSNTGHSDQTGRSYVVTDSNGDFTISGNYTCTYSPTAPQVLYLYSVGGNSGSGTNSGAGLMAVLGTCPATGTFSSQIPFIYMNEVSTVAAAYALSGYASGAQYIAVGGAGDNANNPPTPLAEQGLINAAANANQLYQVNGAGSPTQSANTTTPGSTAGNVGTVPAALIDSIANSLAACVNTVSTLSNPSSQCASLFGYLPDGSSGALPTDTATAAIYIAKHPGQNVQQIFNLGTGNPVFSPALSTAPYDFTVAINYTAPNVANPIDVAIDAAGNAWVTSPNVSGGNSITKFTSAGVATTFTRASLLNPNYLAIDANGNASGSGSSEATGNIFATAPYSAGASDYLYEIEDGAYQTPSTLAGNDTLIDSYDIVNDGVMYNYIADYGSNRTVVATGGNPATGVSENSTNGTYQYLAADSKGYLWETADATTTANPGEICRAPINGASLGSCSTSNLFVTSPEKIAIDEQYNAWIPDMQVDALYRIVSQSGGITVSPSNGYTGGGLNAPFGVAFDGNGVVWVTNTGASTFGSSSPTTCTGCSISAFDGNPDSPTRGNPITPATVGSAGTSYYSGNGGYTSGNLSGNLGYKNLAIDGSGDIWITNSGASSVAEIIGVAAPSVTPLSYAVKNGYFGQKP